MKLRHFYWITRYHIYQPVFFIFFYQPATLFKTFFISLRHLIYIFHFFYQPAILFFYYPATLLFYFLSACDTFFIYSISYQPATLLLAHTVLHLPACICQRKLEIFNVLQRKRLPCITGFYGSIFISLYLSVQNHR